MVNSYYCGLLGRDETEIVGLRSRDIYPARIAALYEQQIDDAIAARRPLVFDTAARQSSGAIRHFMLTRFQIYDDRGMLLPLGSLRLHIRHRKQPEAALRNQAPAPEP